MQKEQEETMKIFTGWWFGATPWNAIKIGVSRGVPNLSERFHELKELAPTYQMLKMSDDLYMRSYMRHLMLLDPERIVKRLEELSEGFDVILCCYERPQDDEAWCHRGYISAWLNDTLGLEVVEIERPNDGFGWSHPKIPARFRK